MTRGQICFLHEFCTDCPLRAICTVRPLFYSDTQYEEYRQQVLYVSKHIVESMNLPKDDISIGLDVGISMMDKRRKRELELHPTYSTN